MNKIHGGKLFAAVLMLLISIPLRGADDRWEALEQKAMDLYGSGENAKAIEVANQALDIAGTDAGPDYPSVVKGLFGLAELYSSKREFAQAELLFQRGVAITEKALGPDHPEVAQRLFSLVDLYEYQGEPAKGEPLFERMMAIKSKVQAWESLSEKATELYGSGDVEKAIDVGKEALQQAETIFGSQHLDVVKSLDDLAGMHSSQSEYVQAEPLLLRALAIREKALGLDHPDITPNLDSLADLGFREQWNAKPG